MPGRDRAVLHERADLLRQEQQAQGVGHGRAGLADARGGLLLRQAVFLHQALIALGLLHGIEVLPLQVLHKGQLHNGAVVGLEHNDGHLAQARHPGRQRRSPAMI